LVHDAARPCLSSADLNRLLDEGLESETGAILAVPVNDTLKLEDDNGCIEQTVDRSHFWAAQTPQLFRINELLLNLEAALSAGLLPTDEASAMEFAGVAPLLVNGSTTNIKITGAEDLALAEFILQQQLVRE
jgi:2-C-methyl-D-erythritol 4-phosphate cytidylyltransferase